MVRLAEFGLIDRYFTRQAVSNPLTRRGVGDDCALLSVPAGADLAVTTDTLVEGVHFFPGADPESLGHKALAVNLSDLAAMGAKPLWVCLALTLPEVNEAWLSGFSKGFLGLAATFGAELIGGDTTRGPLTITVQAMGVVPAGQAVTRSAGRPGHRIYVTGSLGEAGLALKARLGHAGCCAGAQALRRLHRPTPRVEEGMAIRPVASACIDVSDGLLADLGHILQASGVGARVEWEKLPLSTEVADYVARTGDWMLPLAAGDDYELCFTVDPEREGELLAITRGFSVPCTAIGTIEAEKGLRLLRSGTPVTVPATGYEHFSGPEGR